MPAEEQSIWHEEIYRLRPTDLVDAGEDGVSNLPSDQLRDRTRWQRDMHVAMALANWPYHRSFDALERIASSADGETLIAVGGDVERLYRSLDGGHSWQASSSVILNVRFRDVVEVSPGVWCAVGNNTVTNAGVVAFSSDNGATWSLGDSEAAETFVGVAVSPDGSVGVAVASTASIYTFDPQSPADSLQFRAGPTIMSAVAYGLFNGQPAFVAACSNTGSSGGWWRALLSDLSSWQQVAGISTSVAWRDLKYSAHHDAWIGCGSSGSDRLTHLQGTDVGSVPTAQFGEWYGVALVDGGRHVVLVGDDGAVGYGDPLVGIRRAPTGSAANFRGVAFDSRRAVAVGDTELWSSLARW
jgi:hypothetical protein